MILYYKLNIDNKFCAPLETKRWTRPNLSTAVVGGTAMVGRGRVENGDSVPARWRWRLKRLRRAASSSAAAAAGTKMAHDDRLASLLIVLLKSPEIGPHFRCLVSIINSSMFVKPIHYF